MKICCFTELWESGGIEAFLFGALSNMDLDELEVHIVCSKLGESIFTKRLEELNVKFIELAGHPRSHKNIRLWKELLQREKYDTIHFNIFHAFAFRYIKYAKKAGVRIRIAHAHGAGLRKTPTRPLKMALHKIGRRLWKSAITHRLACSSFASDFLFGDKKATVIKNGINTAAYAFCPESRCDIRKSLKLENSVVIGHVGRFSKEKNQSFLLGMLSALKDRLPDSKLLLVGDGSDRDELTTLADELGIKDDTIFYGVSDNVPAILCAMDLFVFPSVAEGLGIVAIEAQCSGLPVLCSEAIPPEAHITDLITSLPLDAGYEKWCDKAIELLSLRKDRTSRQKEVFEAGFDISEVANELKKYYTLT